MNPADPTALRRCRRAGWLAGGALAVAATFAGCAAGPPTVPTPAADLAPARSAARLGVGSTLATDPTTRKTNELLAAVGANRLEGLKPMNMGAMPGMAGMGDSGMPGMPGMPGMGAGKGQGMEGRDHSRMPGMGSPGPKPPDPAGMDGMPGMGPGPSASPSPGAKPPSPSAPATAAEMKKTAAEMKKASDALKAKADALKKAPRRKADAKPTPESAQP